MRKIEKEAGNVFGRTMRTLKSIDRILDFREAMPMERFFQHIKGGEVKCIRVTAENRIHYEHFAAGWGSASAADGLSFVTVYYSFVESSVYKEKSDECHVGRQYHEVNKKEVKMLEEQNMLTAQKRVEELQIMFPGIEVFLDIPGEKDLMKRVDELQRKGIKPFAVTPLG